MADWRELGEIPDSDDESFDSQSTAGGRSPLPADGAQPTDIWDVPTSAEEEHIRNHHIAVEISRDPTASANSSPLSSTHSDADFEGVHDLARNTLTQASNGTIQRDEPRNDIPQDDISQSLVSGLEIDLFGGQHTTVASRAKPLVTQGLPGGLFGTSLAAYSEAPYYRSLRPRKPIQEHPYLIEKTNYSNILRRHGVKPVSAALTSSKNHSTHDDDESFDEDTQSTARLPDNDRSDGADDDPFGLAADFLSSSPNKGGDQTDAFRSRSIYARDDADLPTLEELANQARHAISRAPIDTPDSAARKRRRLDLIHSDSIDVTNSGHATSDTTPTTNPEASRKRATMGSERTRKYQTSRLDAHDVIDLDPVLLPDVDMVDAGANSEQSDRSDIESEPPEEEEHMLGRISKRIKGVLPASWIRLDQHAIKKKELDKSLQRRHVNSLLNKDNRRGVAQVRRSSKPHVLHSWLDDESDDEPTTSAPQPVPLLQTELGFESPPNKENDSIHVVLSDSSSSDMELDVFDVMYSANQRQPRARQIIKTQRKPGTSTGLQKQRSLIGNHQEPRTSNIQRHSGGSHRRTQKKNKQSRLAINQYRTAPQLSVLDVIESDAPRFLKIAARSARRQPKQGRSNLAKKNIVLASEEDHSDVLKTLNSWKRGSITPRMSVSQALKRQHKTPSTSSTTRRREREGNKTRLIPSSTAPNPTRRMVKRVFSDGTISFSKPMTTSSAMASKTVSQASAPRQFGPAARPAQMETEATYKQRRLEFHMRKKALDLVYKRSMTNNGRKGDEFSEANFERQMLQTWRSTPSTTTGNTVTVAEVPKPRKPRKQSRPKHVDVHESRFRHQLGPSLFEQEPSSTAHSLPDEGKLLGLGSFGTHYSIHFDIYPLFAGTYFHETTLIGSGVIAACSNIGNRIQSAPSTKQSSFQIGRQHFMWSAWDEQTSSELGIILDYAGDHLDLDISSAAVATSFVRDYILSQLRLQNELQVRSFAARVTETTNALRERIATYLSSSPITEEHGIWAIFDDLVLIGLCNVEICRQQPMLLNEQISSENSLKAIAKLTISILNEVGSAPITSGCSRMRDAPARERGFRADMRIIHSWVLLIKAFEVASILRGSFWDVACATLLTPTVATSMDVNVHEKVWKLVFTLLPLFEFDSDGLLHPDRRYSVSEDGWPLVQRLTKHVFSAYNSNPRQPSNFNNYCRTLLSRCHTLVRQWGWGNASGIIGTIFDFFGAHNLEHLRNEEAFRSPQFLEDLAASPSLELEHTDKCFHIFLKLLALSILKLREAGVAKDISNIIARTIPNHNRQYLKEQVIHERDLAALRNHHDLLCTLFWASPRALRPQLTLIEHLVTPESSHKEACLINLRAWNQLARFIVSNGEVETSFKPFLQWQKAFLQNTLQQFDSIATDIQQQLSAFPKDLARSFSAETVNNMVLINKRAVSDVLHSMTCCSLDVAKHAGNLEAAIYSVNIFLLQKIFTHFSRSPPEFEWPVLANVLSILDVFLQYVDVATANEDSQPSASQLLDETMGDDALLLLDNDISKTLFSMVRTLIATQAQPGSMTRSSDRTSCTEQAVALAARLVHRFIAGGLITLSAVASPSAYMLFKKTWLNLNGGEKQYAVLFVSTLLKLGICDFSDLGFTLLELWLLSIVKPERDLFFELQLAEQLKMHGEEFVPDLPDKRSMSYVFMSELFEYAIAVMRRSVHNAEPGDKKALVADYAKALRLVMEQMKRDLMVLASSAEVIHASYVLFVRHVISLIRAHGSEICTVDDFYYQITKEYSPSIQDPQLQVAGMVSYGLRLQDGDSRVGQQLFFFLLNNAKQAIIRNKLGDGISLLRRGFADANVAGFILRSLLPAIFCATLKKSAVYPLLDIYLQSLNAIYGNLIVARSVGNTDAIATIFGHVHEGFSSWCQAQRVLGLEDLHIIRQLVVSMNVLWPALFESFLNELLPATLQDDAHLGQLSAMFQEAVMYMRGRIVSSGERTDMTHLFGTPEDSISLGGQQMDPQTLSFTDHIVRDVDKNWVQANGKVNIQTTVKDAQGVDMPVLDAEVLITDIELEMREWLRWWDKLCGRTLTAEHREDDDLIF